MRRNRHTRKRACNRPAAKQTARPRFSYQLFLARRLLDLLCQYPGGLTRAIIESELAKHWSIDGSQHSLGRSKKYTALESLSDTKLATQSMVFEAALVRTHTLDGTDTWMFSFESRFAMDMFVHRKFYFLQDPMFKGFLQNRVFRITQTKSILNLPALLRSDHAVAHRLLPTDMLVPLLSLDSPADCEFLETHFNMFLGDMTVEGIQSGTDYRIVFKITSIGDAHDTMLNGRHSKRIVNMQDATGRRGRLVLWDTQLALTTLMRKGDSVAIWRPFVSSQSVADPDMVDMEYGTGTVLFLIPADATKEVELMATLPTQMHRKPGTHIEYPRDEDGRADLEWYLEQLDLEQLPPNSYNVTLFGMVTAMFPNDPAISSNRVQERCGIRIQSPTGVCDVTLWSTAAVAASALDIGHVVLLEQLATYSDADGRVVVIGSPEHGTKVGNVTACMGIMTSPSMFCSTPISAIRQARCGLFYTHCIVAGWPHADDIDKPFTQSVHTLCRKPVMDLDDMSFCGGCSSYVDAVERVLSLTVRLDDGEHVIDAHIQDGAAMDLLWGRTTPTQFTNLPRYAQKDILHSVEGMAVLCAVTVFTNNGQTVCRVDKVDIKPNVVVQIQHLLTQMES
ncbi:hypothetical protein BC831DRAFT_133045 [Entophlyctis helioformis]|nr:hypothetical protein BC831DRAFT_133045 [Entophlyctis helioformis]